MAGYKYIVCDKRGNPRFETTRKDEAVSLLETDASVRGGYVEYDDGKLARKPRPRSRMPRARRNPPNGTASDLAAVSKGTLPFYRGGAGALRAGSAYFTSSKMMAGFYGAVKEYRLKLSHPKFVTSAEWGGFDATSLRFDPTPVEALRRGGYDSAVWANDTPKGRMYTVFALDGLKVAKPSRKTGNPVYLLRSNPWTPAKTKPDMSQMEGPMRATKKVASAVRGIKPGSTYYYDPERDAYYSPKREAWFSIAVTARPKVDSEIAEARKLAENEAAQLTIEINRRERAIEESVRGKARIEGRSAAQRDKMIDRAMKDDSRLRLIKGQRTRQLNIITSLTPKRAPPEKRDKHPMPPLIKRRIRAAAKKGIPEMFIELPEAGGKDEEAQGIARLYFDRNGPEGAYIESVLDTYIPPLKPRVDAAKKFGMPAPPELSPYRGALGYWGLPLDDVPEVVNKLSGRVRIRGRWKFDMSKQLTALDRKAKAVKRKFTQGKIAMAPSIQLLEGTDPETGKKMEIQKDGIAFLMSRNRAILADSMGLGKTLQAVVAAHNTVPAREQILVLCPAAVVGNWKSEVQWMEPGAPVTIVTNSVRVGGDKTIGENFAVGRRYPDSKAAKKKFGTLAGKLVDGEPSREGTKWRFVIASYQGAASRHGDAPLRKYLMSIHWGCVILDEAHRLKKPETLGHKFVEKLETDRLWMLTGTPIASRPKDYFGLLKLGNHPLGSHMARFMAAYTPDRIGEGGADAPVVNRQVLKKLGNAISGFVLQRDKRSIADQLPKKIGTLGDRAGIVFVDVPQKLLRSPGKKAGAREVMRRELAQAKAPATWDMAERAVDGDNKVVLFTTYVDVMREFAALATQSHLLAVEVSGSISTMGKKAAVAMFQGDKLNDEEAAYARKKFGNHWLLWLDRVPYEEWSAADKERAKHDPVFGSNRQKWPPHHISVFIGQMVAASEGVTLTAADVLIMNDLDYMPSRHLQGEDRIWRKSKKASPFKTVYIAYMLAKAPLDWKLWELLNEKKAEIDDVYGATASDADAVAAKIRKEYGERLRRAYGIVQKQGRETRIHKRAARSRKRKKS